jgi:hypothetical protein
VSPKKAVKLADWAAWLKKNNRLGHPTLGLGIAHVYDHIEAIGKARPYTLAELHLFGHASSSHLHGSGTAFVNTYEWRPPGWPTGLTMPPDKRSPLDLDARANVDFLGRGGTFRSAFAPGALSYVWGCQWHRPDHALIRAVRLALKGRMLQDVQTFDIPITHSALEADKFVEMFKEPFKGASHRLGAASGEWDAKKQIWRGLPGKWVRAYVALLLDRTYMQALANASRRCVLGGLPATYSNYDSKPEPPEPRLSHIPMGPRHYLSQEEAKKAEDYTPVMMFFKNSFGTRFGPGHHPTFGRGFAIYEPH